MTVAVGYTRLSQDSDTSIARQKKHIQEYATERGFELQQIFDEGEGASRFDTTREEYDKLVQAAPVQGIDPGRYPPFHTSRYVRMDVPSCKTGSCFLMS